MIDPVGFVRHPHASKHGFPLASVVAQGNLPQAYRKGWQAVHAYSTPSLTAQNVHPRNATASRQTSPGSSVLCSQKPPPQRLVPCIHQALKQQSAPKYPTS
ncbi:unnamed protein product [Ectocarpus sp. 12 AP-2014]